MTVFNNDIKVYIASPYTNGDKVANVRLQLETGAALMNLGYKPYIPLAVSYLMQLMFPRNHEEWMSLDLAYVRTCNALLRLRLYDKNGTEIPSEGADREEAEARAIGIPVFYTLQDLNVHFKSDPDNYWVQAKIDAK